MGRKVTGCLKRVLWQEENPGATVANAFCKEERNHLHATRQAILSADAVNFNRPSPAILTIAKTINAR